MSEWGDKIYKDLDRLKREIKAWAKIVDDVKRGEYDSSKDSKYKS